MRRWLAALALLLVPVQAFACAVCGAAVERSRMAFLGTTILLSLLPLALIGMGLLWLARTAPRRIAYEFEERVLPGTEQAEGSAHAAKPPGGTTALAAPGAGPKA